MSAQEKGVAMLTAQEVAARLRVSPRMVYDLAAAGNLPVYRIGSAVRFDPADVEAFRESCRSTGTKQSAAGVSTIKAQSPDGESELAAYFRKDSQRRKLSRTTGKKPRASLRLVVARK